MNDYVLCCQFRHHLIFSHSRPSSQCSDVDKKYNKQTDKAKIEKKLSAAVSFSMTDPLLVKMEVVICLLGLLDGDGSQLGLSVGVALNVGN